MGKVVIEGVEFLFNKLYQNDSETDEIVADMFSGNKLITYVEMETVTIINYGAFYGCSNLTTAIFKNLRVLGNHVFAGCNFKTIDISNVVSMGNLCFGACQSLETITLNDEITKIDVGTFSNCRGLTSIHLPENLEKIEKQAFSGARKLVLTQLPKKVRTIGEFCFRECYAFKNLTLGSKEYPMIAIGNGAFYSCTNLTNLTIYTTDGSNGNPATTIGISVFYNCPNLTKITIYTTGGQAPAGAPWGATNATITYLPA